MKNKGNLVESMMAGLSDTGAVKGGLCVGVPETIKGSPAAPEGAPGRLRFSGEKISSGLAGSWN